MISHAYKCLTHKLRKMPVTFDPECGPKCRSKNHAYELVSAITKGNLAEVQAFAKLCHAAGHHNDMFGRSALHMAASCGKVEIVEWLIEEKGGDLTLKDAESGWTALHRSMFYGQLATVRLLVQVNSKKVNHNLNFFYDLMYL